MVGPFLAIIRQIFATCMEKNIGVEARTLTVKRRMKARTAETRSI
jgi:hypothetical protein